jgi:hypothetical protein
MQKTVLTQIEELNRMSLEQLRKRWRDLMGSDPGRLARAYLVRRLAYRIQELAFGGLSASVRKQLTAIAKRAAETEAETKTRKRRRRRNDHQLQPGTRLLREWHGQQYEVVVQDGGFLFEGKVYSSLSAIAKQITGAVWNGRRWFGVSPDR